MHTESLVMSSYFSTIFICFPALTKVYEKANSMITHEVSCPNWLHKYIIGRKGASIQKLNKEYPNVSLKFTVLIVCLLLLNDVQSFMRVI